MKKKVMNLMIIVCIIAMIGCVGCGAPTNEIEENIKISPSENQFDATVLEIHEEYLMVEALEGQTVAGEVQVWIGLLSAEEIPEMENGDTVRITHDGKMTMSLPPQMSAVEAIEVLDSI